VLAEADLGGGPGDDDQAGGQFQTRGGCNKWLLSWWRLGGGNLIARGLVM